MTGGTGFVGSHVTEALLAAGHRVRALVRRPADPGWLKGIPVEVSTGDVRDPAALGRFVDGADAIVHVAGKTSARDEAEYQASNALGTANLVAAAREGARGAHFVLMSSQAAAGPSPDGRPVQAADPCRPISAYGRSKRAGEEAVLGARGLGFTILRPCSVYGPREAAIRDLFVAASRGVVPVLAGGRPRVQMLFAADLAASVVAALARGPRNEIFFAAHPEILSFGEISGILSTLPARRPVRVPVPEFLIRAAGLAAGALSALGKGPPVFNREKAEEMLQPAWLCDVSDAQAALGQPFRTVFADGARRTYAWYQSQGLITR